MHSKIIQICTKPVEKESFINPDDISTYEQDSHGIDYVQNIEQGARERIIAHLSHDWDYLPRNVFKVNIDGSIDIISDGTEYIRSVLEKAKEYLNQVSAERFFSSMPWLRLKTLCNDFSEDTFMYHFEEWTGGLCDLESLISYAQDHVGEKLYIGAILDYHF